MSNKLTFTKKIHLAYSTIDNPFGIILNKIAYTKERVMLFKSRSGIRFYTRSGTTDIDEAIVILSGLEYPKEYLGINDTKKPVVIDAGAHIGFFSLYVKNIYPSARIYAIEPLKDNIKLLKNNLYINSIRDVKILKLALAEKNGKVYILLPKKTHYDTATTILSNKLYYKKQLVGSQTLSGIINNEGIGKVDLLKLDIEGAEYRIIKNDMNLLVRKFRNLLIEYHADKDLKLKNKMIKLLLNHNFKKTYEFRHILGFTNKRNI